MLQLVDDPIATLTEAARVVRPGGRVIAILSNSEFDPADEIAGIIDGLAPLRAERLDRNQILDADLSGLTLAHKGYTPWDEFPSTITDEIDHIENRIYSSLFDVDDATWTRIVEPVLAQLRSSPNRIALASAATAIPSWSGRQHGSDPCCPPSGWGQH